MASAGQYLDKAYPTGAGFGRLYLLGGGRDSMAPSLCESCRWMRAVVTPKGSRFLLCELALTRPEYAKYPPQPIVRCQGYEAKKPKE